MPKLIHTQTSFSSGELSPLMAGRTSLSQYANGAQSIVNMVVLPQGGLTKRPGTEFIREVKDSADYTILIPFIVGSEQSYVLELGDLYMRFYRDGGILLSTAAITNGTFTTDLSGWTDDDTGTGASTQTAGLMRLNGGGAGVAARTQPVSYVGTAQYTLTFTSSTNTCTYRIGTTSGGTEIASGTSSLGANNINFTPSAAGTIYIQFRNANNNNADVDTVSISTPVYELPTAYTSAMLDDLQWAQSKDTMYIAHGTTPLKKLRRFGASQWDIVGVDLVDGPYYSKTDENWGGVGTGITVTPSALTGTINLTASAPLFASTDVGRPIRWRKDTASEWSEVSITGYTSSTVVTGAVQKVLVGPAGASTEWRLGYFSATTGYPNCVTFHEQRLVLANTTDKPQTVWFSKAGDIEVFQPDNSTYKDEVDATTAMTYTVASRDTNDVRWLSSRNVLFLGTSGAVFVAKASSLDEALTPNNISIKPAVKAPTYTTLPIETSDATLYVHLHQRKVMELAYSVAQDSMASIDLNILADHLTVGYVKRIVRQEEPFNVVWAMNADGTLNGLTYLREQQVVGWHTHTFGGTNSLVKSIACIPGTGQTELWLIVSRTINGSTKQYVERLTPYFREGVADKDAYFLDSGIRYTGAPATSITGLTHLEGATVKAFTDGYVGVVSNVVTGGSITVQEAASDAIVGLGYTASVQGLAIEVQSQGGSLQGNLARIWKSFIRFYRSALARVGYSADTVNIVENFGDNYTMGGAIPLFTGIKEIPFNHSAELEIYPYIEQDQPAPLTILSVGSKIILDDDR